MTNLIKKTIDEFYSNDVLIEGKGLKTFNMEGISISLKSDYLKYFVLLIPNNPKYDWYIHFENFSDKPFTAKEKEILFGEVSRIIQPGEILTTEGGVTPGGISGLHKLLHYGFTEIGTNSGKNVYWASKRTMNMKRWNEWIKKTDDDNYIHTDDSEPLTPENTRPVVLVLQKD